MTTAAIMTPTEMRTVEKALRIMERRMTYCENIHLNAPELVKDFLKLKMGHLEHEVFSILFLNAQNQLIEYEELFRGTVSQTSVYPREVVKRALQLNASSVILVHNHPSGVSEPSRADELLTQTLKSSLSLVDVRVLDHLIVGKTVLSFAERGLL